jgi:hypothetical protein
MYPFQMGMGANWFAMVHGACQWLYYERHTADGKVWKGNGDVNLDAPPIVPPAHCDQCSNGQCTGVKVNCDDGNPCTLDACDPATGQCTHAPIKGCVCG